MKPEKFELVISLEMYKVDTREVLPASNDLKGWQDLLVDWIDNMDGVPVCTDTEHQSCNQHLSFMEDSEWRIGSLMVLHDN